MLRWLIGIILGEIICESSNWQHIQRLKITILGANWQLFRLERIAKCVYTKHQVLLICNENLCCQFDDTIEVDFLLGINIWGLHSEWDKGRAPMSDRYQVDDRPTSSQPLHFQSEASSQNNPAHRHTFN